MFELHAHTTASDGVLTPSALVEYALARGVTALAVTDHDTLRGIPEAAARGRDLGIEVIPGIEATCDAGAAPGAGAGAELEVHILGLYVDPASRDLAQAFARLRARRIERMHAMIRTLRALGITVDAAEVMTAAMGPLSSAKPSDYGPKEASFGRPHLARALVARGYCASVPEAFDRWLAEGRPACEPKALLPSGEGIAAIRAAGGLAVLAHPGRYREPPDLGRLRDQGLGGLEVYYPSHPPDVQDRLLAEARRLGLVATGGSDFHGDPGRRPDLGGQPMPDDVLENVRRAVGR